MGHITNGKVKTNMLLIWCGPDGEDMYGNFELEEREMYDIDLIMEHLSCTVSPSATFVLLDINSNRLLRGNMK